ncbi:MAG TPA: tetratricopeptide repeat protein [Chryseolinea sp.]
MGSSKGVVALCLLLLVGATALSQSKVTDSLQRALRLSEKEARVDLLNQLTYEFISVDNDKVLEYNNEAIELSRKLEYVKGQAIAHTYRGVYEYLSGQFPEARKDLHLGLRLSTEAGDIGNKGYTLLQLGVCSLEEVENDSALFYFGKAHEIFRDSANPVTLSKIYRNMSALYGQRYKYDLQETYLDRAITIRRLLADKTLLVDALALKANNKLTSGDLPAAEAYLDEAETIVKNYPEDAEDLNDIRHLRALILFQKGEFDDAVVLLDSARNYYFRKSLVRKYVTLLSDLGKVFSDRGEYELALNNLYEALNLCRLRGFDAEAYVIRNRIGWVNFHLGDMRQALLLANEGLISRKKQLKGDLADAMTLKGVVLTELNDYAAAKACLDSVLILNNELGDLRGVSEALMNIAFLESKQGHHESALTLYKRSIRLAEAANYSFGLAWSQWGIGDILFKKGNFPLASEYLDLSEEYCHLTNSNELLILNYNTRRDLLAAQKNFKGSLKYSMLASQLKDSIHRTDLARRFVNLEKVQEIEERDRDIRMLQKDKQLAEDKIHLQESKLQQQFILLVAGFICIALLGALAILYHRFYTRIKILNVTITEKNKRIQAQADRLKEVNVELHDLYSEVTEQNEKIKAQAHKLTESNKNISDLNRSLELIVAEKTLELRTTNEELVKHNNELLQFSYTVSHNLRGPVARLLGLSDLAQAEEKLEHARRWIDLISKTASDLDSIIKDLNKVLDLRNEPDQYLEMVNLADEWQQSISLLEDSITGQEEIVANFNALPKIITVRAMLQSTLYNLLSNAIKYRSPERKLRVVATSRVIDGKAIIEVTDNGLGVDTRLHKEKMFKLYKRFHTHVEGRGIGLYLIKAQIEVLHGTIEVESQLDHGSMFRVTLPLVVQESSPMSDLRDTVEISAPRSIRPAKH